MEQLFKSSTFTVHSSRETDILYNKPVKPFTLFSTNMIVERQYMKSMIIYMLYKRMQAVYLTAIRRSKNILYLKQYFSVEYILYNCALRGTVVSLIHFIHIICRLKLYLIILHYQFYQAQWVRLASRPFAIRCTCSFLNRSEMNNPSSNPWFGDWMFVYPILHVMKDW